jgi:FKBP-type peptidyl-prolyl cis-trans isomerase
MKLVSTKKEQTREGLRSESMDREAKSMEQIREATRHYLLAIKELEVDEFEEIRMMLEQYTGWEYDLTKKEDTALKSSTQKKSDPRHGDQTTSDAVCYYLRSSTNRAIDVPGEQCR